MPTAPLRPCAAPGCRELVSSGRCTRHALTGWQDATTAKAYDRERGSAAARGYGGEWRRIRNRFIRAHPVCEHCAREGRTTIATEVDHVIPLSKGGTHADENLSALCHSCHMRKTQHDGSRG
jgi:5-methylcytosine-specific restriction enzyme A